MATFKSSRYIPIGNVDLGLVAEDLAKHFQAQEFEVQQESTLVGGWHIDIAKGGTFKTILGMKTALKIELEPSGNGTLAKAGIGIF